MAVAKMWTAKKVEGPTKLSYNYIGRGRKVEIVMCARHNQRMNKRSTGKLTVCVANLAQKNENWSSARYGLSCWLIADQNEAGSSDDGILEPQQGAQARHLIGI